MYFLSIEGPMEEENERFMLKEKSCTEGGEKGESTHNQDENSCERYKMRDKKSSFLGSLLLGEFSPKLGHWGECIKSCKD